jgi:hypothetical protein
MRWMNLALLRALLGTNKAQGTNKKDEDPSWDGRGTVRPIYTTTAIAYMRQLTTVTPPG